MWVFGGIDQGAYGVAEARPHMLDTATVEQVIRVYTQQHADLWLYKAQFARWKADAWRVDQRRELARLEQHFVCCARRWR